MRITAGVLMTVLLFATPSVAAQMSNAQIQNLLGALRALDAGSAAQCASAPKDKDTKPATASPQACPYHKSAKLIETMARDMVALEPADREFKIQLNAVRSEVLAGQKQASTVQELDFANRSGKILDQMRDVPALVHIKIGDLDLGPAPDHNDLPATLLAGLSPIIDDFAAGEAKK